MEARAIGRGIRISPQKARLVADIVRGMNVDKAINVLNFLVFNEIIRIIFICIPNRIPCPGYIKSHSQWINFLPQNNPPSKYFAH